MLNNMLLHSPVSKINHKEHQKTLRDEWPQKDNTSKPRDRAKQQKRKPVPR